MVAAESLVHEGESLVGGFEKERVVVTADLLVEYGETGGCQCIVGTWFEGSLRRWSVGSEKSASRLVLTHNHFRNSQAKLFELRRCALIGIDHVPPIAMRRLVGSHGD